MQANWKNWSVDYVSLGRNYEEALFTEPVYCEFVQDEQFKIRGPVECQCDWPMLGRRLATNTSCAFRASLV